MKKLIIAIMCVITACLVLVLISPPGEDVLWSYEEYVTNSKSSFRSKKQFKEDMDIMQNGTSGSGSQGGSSGGSSGATGTGKYVDVPLPADMSQANLQVWLQTLSISPERRAILAFEIDSMGTVVYCYGGQGRARYKEEVSNWGTGQDCSGMVTAAYYRGGIDFGYAPSTGEMMTKFANQAISREQAMPGDFFVVNGHTEVYLGHTTSGDFVFIGVRTAKDPPGPLTAVNHKKLMSAGAICVRHTQLQAFDDAYYATQ